MSIYTCHLKCSLYIAIVIYKPTLYSNRKPSLQITLPTLDNNPVGPSYWADLNTTLSRSPLYSMYNKLPPYRTDMARQALQAFTSR